MVVDRANLAYSRRVNQLTVANLFSRFADSLDAPNLMANQNGLERDCNLAPALTINAKEARNG